MFRNKSDEPDMHLVIVSDFGALGDDITRMPALKYLMEVLRPKVKVDLFIKDYAHTFWTTLLGQYEFSKRLTVHKHSTLAPWTEANRHRRLPYIDFRPQEITSLKMHLIDHAFIKLCQDVVEGPERLKVRTYLQPDLTHLPRHKMQPEGPYAVLNTNATAYVKHWHKSSLDDTARWLKDEGILPVFVGANKGLSYAGLTEAERAAYTDSRYKPQSTDADVSLGVDLRGDTSLIESLTLIADAKVYVGIEGGLAHMAGMTKTPAVIGYTFRGPDKTLPIREGVLGRGVVAVEPDADLGCRFCQSKATWLYEHDFRECFYKDYKCVDQMTSSKFIGALRQILKPGSWGAKQP